MEQYSERSKWSLPSPHNLKYIKFIAVAAIYIILCLLYMFKGFPRTRMEKAVAPHSSTLAWKIPWMEEPGRLQSMGSLRVGHDWTISLSLLTFMHWRRKWQPTPVFLPGESQGRGSLVGCRLWGHTVGHDWSDLAAAAARTRKLYILCWQSTPQPVFS